MGGTHADAVFQPHGSSSDDWIGIQIKSTSRAERGVHRFRHTSGYSGLLLFCFSIHSHLCWAIPGREVTVSSLVIRNCGKWDGKYRCLDIPLALKACWEAEGLYVRRSLADWSMPTFLGHQVEHRSRQYLTALLCSAGLSVESPL